MIFLRAHTLPLLALAVLAIVLLVGCAVPLAPGYSIERERFEVRYLADAAPHLAIRAEYRLKNVGNSTLTSVTARLPGSTLYRMQNLQLEIDGRPVSLPLLPYETGASAAQEERMIPFDPAWDRKLKRFVAIQYGLNANPTDQAALTVDTLSFYLPSSGWFPAFEEPRNLFAHDIRRPAPTDFVLLVPDSFRVHAAGALAGTHRSSGQTEWRFRIGRRDPNPFVVAGTYQEQVVKASDTEMSFWTFQQLPPGAVTAAGTRLAATLSTYTAVFGPLSKPPLRVWIAQTQSNLNPSLAGPRPDFETTFPDGLLLDQTALASGIQSEGFLASVEEALAHLWLGERVRIQPEAELVMRNGFARYATIVAAESRGGEPARRKEILSLLDAYKHPQSPVGEKALMAKRWVGPREQSAIPPDKAPLFFIALEDEYSESVIRRGIARLVSSLRGQSVGLSDLRSALEMETGKNLGDFFRVWLNQPGIPADFQSRYLQPASSQDVQRQKMENQK